jgi:hypothetical protein
MARWLIVVVGVLGGVLGALVAVLASAADVIASDTCREISRGSDFAVMSCSYRRFLGLVLSPEAAYVLAGLLGAMIGATLGAVAVYGITRTGRTVDRA